MKSVLMVSVAAAALSLAGAAPAFAACSDEIAQLKSQTFTGSVNSGSNANQAAAAQPLPTDTTTAGQATAAATAAETTGTPNTSATSKPIPDQAASAATTTDQSSGAPGMDAQQTAAANSAGAGKVVPDQGGSPAPGSVPGTEATAAMNAVTQGQGIAASPAEVNAQQTAQPAETAPKPEQVAAAGQQEVPSAAPTSGGEPVDMKATILARAEAYQKLGNEGACMNLLDQAKTLTQ